MVPDLEECAVVWSNDGVVVDVRAGPLVIVESASEDIAPEQAFEDETFLHQIGKIFVEQVTCSVVVLILDDVIDHQLDSANLVCFQSAIHGSSIKVLVLRASFINLIQVENWELIREVLVVILAKQRIHRSAIEREN